MKHSFKIITYRLCSTRSTLAGLTPKQPFLPDNANNLYLFKYNMQINLELRKLSEV